LEDDLVASAMGDRLPDMLDHGLRAVFCGTAAGPASARLSAYYAGAGNRFWETLYEVGLTPRQLRPEEFRELLTWGLGLTDLCKTGAGMDRDITDEPFDIDRLRQSILAFAPRALAFNGKASAAAYFNCKTRDLDYGMQRAGLGPTLIYVLPSTSPASRSHWDIRYWRALADDLHALGEAGS
jgi:double-stranded uracil-DNA glycosylase